MEETFEAIEEDDFGTPNNMEGLVAPSSGMSFETIEEAQKYYKEYGRQNSFWIRTRISSKARNRSAEVSNTLFVCPKEGKHVAWTKKDGVVE
ncbi:hypothetical protein Vadar_010956 [Vaccinium darrowii]|uniref:Uncharacterized protein n=1 Tax=Vaccinium darrowii TaxID=229202 RepID=A0ACB7X9C2_9ERIC|nr:hypothetical protein Vadar_010956 [Vaccinium darrowii]